MEGIIIMVVIAIISSLFSSNKKKVHKPMPPFGKATSQNFDTPKETTQNKNTSLEDFAKEIFQQLNEKNVLPQELVNPQVEKVEEKKVELQPIQIQNRETINSSRPKFDNNRSTRAVDKTVQVPTKPFEDKIKANEIGDFIPTSREALVQAIITSEIIGAPKAKR